MDQRILLGSSRLHERTWLFTRLRSCVRRLVERGVRFIQLYHRGWDHHGGIKKGIEYTAGFVDQAAAALVTDLKQRGMLDHKRLTFHFQGRDYRLTDVHGKPVKKILS